MLGKCFCTCLASSQTNLYPGDWLVPKAWKSVLMALAGFSQVVFLTFAWHSAWLGSEPGLLKKPSPLHSSWLIWLWIKVLFVCNTPAACWVSLPPSVLSVPGLECRPLLITGSWPCRIAVLRGWLPRTSRVRASHFVSCFLACLFHLTLF